MADHRVRLTDEDAELIVAALNARRAGLTGGRRLRLDQLVERLSEMRPGNPGWTLGALSKVSGQASGPGATEGPANAR